MSKQYDITLEYDGWTKVVTVEEEIMDRGYIYLPMPPMLVPYVVDYRRIDRPVEFRCLVFTPSRRPPYHWFGQPRH